MFQLNASSFISFDAILSCIMTLPRKAGFGTDSYINQLTIRILKPQMRQGYHRDMAYSEG